MPLFSGQVDAVRLCHEADRVRHEHDRVRHEAVRLCYEDEIVLTKHNSGLP